MKPTMLIIEDDPRHWKPLKERFEFRKFRVLVEETGRAGLETAKVAEPDMIILDLRLPDIDGLEVLAALRRDRCTADIPVIAVTADSMVTAVEPLDSGANLFLKKLFTSEELEAHVRALLKQRRFRTPDDEVAVTIFCQHGECSSLDVSRPASYVRGKDRLHLSPSTLAIQADSAMRDQRWRALAKGIGQDLYTRLLRDHPDLLEALRLSMKPGHEEHYRLRLMSPRDHLRVPFEMLFDGSEVKEGDYLVLKHPLSRYVTGVNAHRAPLSREFFDGASATNEEIRVLLVASDTGQIPGVDEEIAALRNLLPGVFESRGFRVFVKGLSTNDTSWDVVEQTLKAGPWHIVHYAGHGSHDANTPEQSSLYFWSDKNRTGKVRAVPAVELVTLAKRAEARFFYLSCCEGTSTAPDTMLLDDDFLGVADALIQAGIPSVLGFRQPVSDRSALKMARAFYLGLARHGELDYALLDARIELSKDRDDITWLTPVLIVQS